jgi:hypothetical protein
MMDRGFIEDNEAARVELRELVSRLDERALQAAVGADWTVSTLLCYLAFWDRRILFLLRNWQSGRFEASRLSSQSVDSINHAVKVISSSVPGPVSATLALDAAAAVDSQLACISDELIEQIVSAGFERILRRSLHRREHLRRIKEALQPRFSR